MIETPSLRTRVTWVSLVVIVGLITALDAFVYVSLRERLDTALGEVLDTRVVLVEELARTTASIDELEQALNDRGLPVVLSSMDGTRTEVAPIRRFDEVPPGAEPGAATESRIVPLDDGWTAQVFVSRGGVEATLQRIVAIELIGSVAAAVLAALLLRRAAGLVTRPLDRIVDTAAEIAGGDRHRRLRPSDPTTELGRMAAAFDRTIDALDAALTEAEQAEERSRQFLANAAHQMRTPLAGLRASAETLLAHPDSPERDKLLGAVARESTRMTRVVDRLLRIARLDRGEELSPAQTDLVALVEDEVERQRALAPELEFAILTSDAVLRLSCDGPRIREALANLLDNARLFAIDRVSVELRAELGRAYMIVRDDGPGPEGDPEAMFERFATTTNGSGLGLPIARGIAEAHGGALGWEGNGFVLTLPMVPFLSRRVPDDDTIVVPMADAVDPDHDSSPPDDDSTDGDADEPRRAAPANSP